jgi:CBS-domain-containing membrane protein
MTSEEAGMPTDHKAPGRGPEAEIDLQEEDILAAMGQIPGYLDITPRDFKDIYVLAFRHALERLSREATVAEIMTREVTWAGPDTPLAEVAAAMGQRGVSGVPVVDEDHRVAGVISEKDFLRAMGVKEAQNFMTLVASCLRSKGCVALPIKKQTAGDLMSAPAVTVTPETRVRDLAELFAARHINRAPVTDADGRLVGIVTRGDLVKATRRGDRP